MNKKEICVVIPIYKETLNDFEMQSVNQCVKILSEYSLFFICPRGLNIDFYKENFPMIEKNSLFDNEYFDGIKGYNRLMLSSFFYKNFADFEYMLIYQTDCYVFKDELLNWANKDFDYIGGVWFEGYHGNPSLGAKLWYPGNGGFSLRKTKEMIKILSSKRPLKNWYQLFDEKIRKRKNILYKLKGTILLPLNVLGFRNNLKYKASKYELFEDVFFMEASLVYNKIKTPKIEDAVFFSWDKYPQYLYDKFKNFPFACHAWYRNDSQYEGNKEFWFKHINKEL